MNAVVAFLVGVMAMFGFVPRAYNQNVDRIVRRSTIVYSADAIRRNITLCVTEKRPCVLELGDDIDVAGRGFALPIGLKSFRVDGGDTYRFIVSRDTPFLFKALGAARAGAGFPVDIANVDILLKPGVNVETMFIVDQAFSVLDAQLTTFSVRGVKIDAGDGQVTGNDRSVTNIFGLADRVGALGHIVVDGLTALNAKNVFAVDDTLSAWVFSQVRNALFDGFDGGPTTIGAGPASAAFVSCLFQSVFGSITVSTGVQSTENLWSVVGGNTSGAFITNDPGGIKPQTLVRVSQFSPKTLSPGDKDLDL